MTSEQIGTAKPAQQGLVDREACARMLWYKHQRLLRDEPASLVHAALAEIDPGFHYLERLGWEPRNGDAKDGEWLSSWDKNGGLSTWLNRNLKRWGLDWLDKEAQKGAADRKTASSLEEGDDHDDDDHDDDSNGKDDGSDNNDEQDQDQPVIRSGTITKPANKHGDQGLPGGSTPGVNDASTGRVPADRPEDASPLGVGNNQQQQPQPKPKLECQGEGEGRCANANPRGTIILPAPLSHSERQTV